jgi:hypothetical protein
MVKNTAEQIIPTEVVEPRCGTPGQAVGFVGSTALRSK